MLAGFAGSVADAITLFEKFEEKLDRYPGNLPRAAVELAKDWRSDRVLRRLEALLVVADLRPHLPAERLRRADRAGRRDPRGRLRRQLRPRRRPGAASRRRRPAAREIVQRALEIAADICVYTNRQHHNSGAARRDDRRRHPQAATPPSRRAPASRALARGDAAAADRRRAGPLHRGAGSGQEGGRHRDPEPLAPGADAGRDPGRDHAVQHHPDRADRRRERPRSPAGWLGWPARRSSKSRRPSSPRWATSAATPSPWCATWWMPRSTWCGPSGRTRSIPQAEQRAEERLLDLLLPPPPVGSRAADGQAGGAAKPSAGVRGRLERAGEGGEAAAGEEERRSRSREKLRQMLARRQARRPRGGDRGRAAELPDARVHAAAPGHGRAPTSTSPRCSRT